MFKKSHKGVLKAKSFSKLKDRSTFSKLGFYIFLEVIDFEFNIIVPKFKIAEEFVKNSLVSLKFFVLGISGSEITNLTKFL